MYNVNAERWVLLKVEQPNTPPRIKLLFSTFDKAYKFASVVSSSKFMNEVVFTTKLSTVKCLEEYYGMSGSMLKKLHETILEFPDYTFKVFESYEDYRQN